MSSVSGTIVRSACKDAHAGSTRIETRIPLVDARGTLSTRLHRRRGDSSTRLWFRSLAIAALIALAGRAPAGGTPENLLLILDPTKPESLYVGNYYKNARNVPDSNVIYVYPGASNYSAFADYNLDVLFGSLTNAGTTDHIDYVVVMPGAPFRIDARDLVSDGCSPVRNFSISSVYTMAFIADDVLDGSLSSTETNRYYRNSDEARGFDSSVKWYGGSPSNSSAARRYFIGCLLGYTGDRGNTVDDIIASIDRSVAVDATRPDGTFYFMKTTDNDRSGPRHGTYTAAVNSIRGLGGKAEKLDGVLPDGKHDCLGIMTGWASPGIEKADIGILSGAFCDHLTSYAGHFGEDSQEKMSRWIAKGASGSWGTVEEPCNYPGKFPHARLHVFYFQGLSLGEATLRSIGYTPFQGLMYGDPMTRPFAYLPTVTVPDAPTEPVSGTITLTPEAHTDRENTAIQSFELLIDGVSRGTVNPGEAFTVDSTTLADGLHDVRVLAYDDSLIKSVGRWVGSMTVDNLGRSASVSASPGSGDWTSPFEFDISTIGQPVTEVRLIQNGRVVASAAGSNAKLTVYGLTLGAGPVKVQAEALFGGYTRVRSEPVMLDIAYSGGSPSGDAPVAFSYTKEVRNDTPFLVELPATYDDSTATLTYELRSSPTKGVVRSPTGAPYRLIDPKADACGSDTFRFYVKSPTGNSNDGTVTIHYGFCAGDMNCDDAIDFDDIDPFVTALISEDDYRGEYPDCVYANADINKDGAVDFNDIDPFVDLLTGG